MVNNLGMSGCHLFLLYDWLRYMKHINIITSMVKPQRPIKDRREHKAINRRYLALARDESSVREEKRKEGEWERGSTAAEGGSQSIP